MTAKMKRREFVTLLGGAAVAWTLAYGHHEDRWPIYGYEPTREGRDGRVREELAAGVVLGRSAFGGKPENIRSF